MKINEIKQIIKEEILIKRLELEDIEADEIKDDMQLFDEEGLALDSIEALDLVSGLQSEFGVKMEDLSSEEMREILQNVEHIADFIEENME